MKSELIDVVIISPHRNSPRLRKIDTITIHCMAGNMTVEQCGALFKRKKASSNYGIGSDGRIALYCPEKDRSWCTDSPENDHRAVTIEVANDGGKESGWHVSDKAMSSLIDLLTDICARNGIRRLLWRADSSLIGQVEKQNMTVHRWFANKACPGDYLYYSHGRIALEVNRRLDEMEYEEFKKHFVRYMAELSAAPADLYAKDALAWAKKNGLMVGTPDGNQMPQSFIKRQDLAVILKKRGE